MAVLISTLSELAEAANTGGPDGSLGVGETIILGNLSFQVVSADNRRVRLLKVTLLLNPDASQASAGA